MRSRLSFVFLLTLFPGLVLALGLGQLDLKSGLNEPLNARIELLSATAEELEGLEVGLADQEVFKRAGIPLAPVLWKLRFRMVETDTGADYIRVTSDDPIREPFLNFLLEVSWSKGRIFREYTVLLDPPIYSAEQLRREFARPVTPPPVTRPIEEHVVVYEPVYKESRPPISATPPAVAGDISYTGGDYGPVISGDTLWSIARAMRFDESVSIQQMMFALLKTNPDAFINGNINGLKRGYVLETPELSEVQSLSREDAFARAKSHNELWEETRGILASAVTPRPESVGAAPTEPTATAAAQIAEETGTAGQPELRLVAAADTQEGADQGAAGAKSNEALTKELILVNESLEALTQENAELKDKLAENEAIIDDLKRLIVLKEDELAALQNQIAAREAAAAEQAEVKEKAASTAAPAPEDEAEPVLEKESAVAMDTEAEKPAVKAEEAALAPEKETKAASEEPGLITLLLPSGLMGLVDQIRNNLMVLAAGLAALLLIVLLVQFAMRRRSAALAGIPAGVFPEIDEMAEKLAASEDTTDTGAALLAESEVETLLPAGAEDETEQPMPPAEEEVRIAARETAQTPAAIGKKAEVAEEAEEAEDPMQEANYYLAYEQYDQAEEFVRKAIEKEPDNLEYRIKLLEVYYTANRKKAYEEVARVLHEKVGGRGDYWTMAVTMWQELSPSRALFAAPAAGEEEPEAAAAAGGGIVDISGAGAEAGEGILDVTAAGEGETDMLDLTAVAGIEDESEALDMTAAAEPQAEAETEEAEAGGLDFSITGNDEVLDVAADEKAGAEVEGALDFTLDFPGAGEEAPETSRDKEEDLLDVTSSIGLDEELSEEGGESPLDISSTGAGDLLDVPSAEDFESEAEEDLLDVTSETAEGMDSEELLDISKSPAATNDNVIDFDVSEVAPEPASAEDPAHDFELTPDAGTAGTEEESAEADFSIDLDTGGEEAGGLEIALDDDSVVEKSPAGTDRTKKPEASEKWGDSKLSLVDDNQDSGLELDITGEAEDDSEHTVFVPRTGQVSEQNENDEIATQLDLAKAYVELGDKDNAKSILDEIIVIGNEKQRQQARELLEQID